MMVSGMLLPKCLRSAEKIACAVGLRGRHVLEVAGREAAAHVDHLQHDALVGQRREHALGVGERAVPGVEVGLLRADMEGDAIGVEAERPGMAQHVDGHRGHAAELARQRPFGALAVGQHAAEHARAGCGAGDLLHFLDAVDGEQPDAQREGARDVALLLDGVAEGDALGRRAGIHRHLDFGDRCGVEGRAHRGKQAQDLRRRVCLHRIVDLGIGKRLGEGAEIVAHDVEVDHQAGAVRTSGREEIEDTLRGHRSLHRAAMPRAIRLRDAGCWPGIHAVDKGGTAIPWNQPVETPEP